MSVPYPPVSSRSSRRRPVLAPLRATQSTARARRKFRRRRAGAAALVLVGAGVLVARPTAHEQPPLVLRAGETGGTRPPMVVFPASAQEPASPATGSP